MHKCEQCDVLVAERGALCVPCRQQNRRNCTAQRRLADKHPTIPGVYALGSRTSEDAR